MPTIGGTPGSAWGHDQHAHGNGSFVTTTSSAFVWYEIDTGWIEVGEPGDESLFLCVFLSSARNVVDLAPTHQSVTRCLAQRSGGVTQIKATSVEISSNSNLVVEFSVSGNLLRVAVNPDDSSDWRHWWVIEQRRLPLAEP